MNQNKKQLTIDTCVLTQAQEGESKVDALKAQQFLRETYLNCHAIVLDKPNNRILKEYRTQAKGFSEEWLISVLRRKKKTCKVDIKNCAVTAKMKNDKFDNKFIQACYESSDKILVTKDNGFNSPELRFLLKKNGITLMNIDQALKFV